MEEIGGRSAIVAQIRLPDRLEAIRLEHVDNARLGVPAHVTLLFPFVPAASIDSRVIAGAAVAIARTAAFDVEFREVTSFDPGPTPEGVVWLRPAPSAPFLVLTESLVDAFPGYLPYEGLHEEVVPHLTLAEMGMDIAGIKRRASETLPFRRRVAAAVLLVEDGSGRWRARRRLPLG